MTADDILLAAIESEQSNVARAVLADHVRAAIESRDREIAALRAELAAWKEAVPRCRCGALSCWQSDGRMAAAWAACDRCVPQGRGFILPGWTKLPWADLVRRGAT